MKSFEMVECPVVTKVSLMFNPRNDSGTDGSISSSSQSQTIGEPEKPKHEDTTFQQQQTPQLMDNPHTLLLLLHLKDLEIKGLKSAAQRDPSDRLGFILQELMKPRQKLSLKRSSSEGSLREAVEKLKSELETIRNDHKKEIQDLEQKLITSQLHVLHLQETVKTLTAKSDDESDTESSTSLDEGTQLACESFELWSESATRIRSEKSDLRLRRIPKHTSFVDAFNQFGNLSSDEDKDVIISHLESIAGKAQLESSTEDSSQESLQAVCKAFSAQSSLAVLTSQKSDVSSMTTDTQMTESSSSLPSSLEKMQPGYSIDLSHPMDSASFISHDLAPRQLTAQGMAWESLSHGMPVDFTEECKRFHTVKDSLKVVSVHRKGKFIRIFNSLLNKEADLSGYIIQQWVGGFPVCIYRFPNGTILPAQHHITVWAAGANLYQKEPSDTSALCTFFKAGPECTTILCDRDGQTVSQYVAPHRFTAAAEAYNDNVDLSVDKFPLTEGDEEHEGPLPSRKEKISPQQGEMASLSGILMQRRLTRHFSAESSSSKIHSIGVRRKTSGASSESSGSNSFSPRTLPPIIVKESRSSTSQEGYFASQTWQPLLDEPKVREFKTTLDATLPMVALIGQKSARSKYGFKYMTYLPTTTDMQLRRYCPAK